MPTPLPDFTGWLLAEARAHLQATAPHCLVRVVESAPPHLRPGDRLGEWRVLRPRALKNAVELLVAREQIGEARASHPRP